MTGMKKGFQKGFHAKGRWFLIFETEAAVFPRPGQVYREQRIGGGHINVNMQQLLGQIRSHYVISSGI